MRKRILLVTSAALIALAVSPALTKPSQSGGGAGRSGINRPAINPQVAALFAQQPNGGPELTAALGALLEQDPTLAGDVVAAARTGNLDQKIAAGQALETAQRALAEAGNAAAAEIIKKAMQQADLQTLAAYQAAQDDVVAREGGEAARGEGGRGRGGGEGGFGGGGGGSGGGTVSPN